MVVERTSYEAARVGEHLSPGCQPVLESLALWPRFIDSGHLPSDGIRVAWGGDSLYERDYMFSAYGRGWNLDRRRFDATLAADAAAAGVGVLTGTQLAALDGGPDRWRCRLRGGRFDGRDVTGRLLVDATGRSAIIAKRLGTLRRAQDRLVGICGWLARGDVCDGSDSEIESSRLLVEAVESGWWYAVPLPERRLAAVLMTDSDLLPAGGCHHGRLCQTRLEETRHVWDRARDHGRRVGFQLKAANSYALEPAAGDWLAVGDAAMAIDPLSSMGVLGALRSGIDAAAAARRCLSGDRHALAGYAETVRQRFSDYLGGRRETYSQERRWPASPFWKRRYALVTLEVC